MSKLVYAAALSVAMATSGVAQAATFLFIRHAESTANAGTATTVAEVYDPPLTALGTQQAADLVGTLSPFNITRIYTSDYQRTQLTIEPTALARGLTPTADGRTDEWYFGDAATLADLAGANIAAVIPQWAAGNTAAKPNLPNAESLDDVVARVLPAWQEIVAAHKNEDGVIVLVGHGVSTGYVLPYFVQNVSTGFAFANSLGNTSIVQVEIINGLPYATTWKDIPLEVPVPAPASLLLLLSGLAALGAVARRAGTAPAAA